MANRINRNHGSWLLSEPPAAIWTLDQTALPMLIKVNASTSLIGMGKKDRSVEWRARQLVKFAQATLEDLAAVPRPYTDRDLAKLTAEQQEKVQLAEMNAHMQVMPGWGEAHIPGMKGWADQFGEKYGLERSGDKERIDDPLQAMRELASAYAETGLAGDAEAAKVMADGFKDAMCRHWEGKHRGRRI
jgi:hypothetical protein